MKQTVRNSRAHLGIALLAAALSVLNGVPVAAQVDPSPRPRSTVAVSFIQTRPVGQFGNHVGTGYGVVGALLIPLDQRGILSLRAEAGAAEYGHEDKRTAFSGSVGGRVEVNVRTVNAIVPMSVGFQLAPFAGTVRPYLHTGIGAQLFYTESYVDPIGIGPALASTVNQFDVAFAWTVGGGFFVPIRRGPRNLMLDVGAKYVRGGRAQYLAPGSIEDLPGGEVTITPIESTTHIMVVHLGVRMEL